MLSKLTPRTTFFAMALVCGALIATALFMQYRMGLEPCPLCMSQRLAFIACGLIAFIAFLHGPRSRGRRLYASFSGLCALAGAAVASRQLWLQSLPEDQVPACGPGLSYMLETFPLLEVISVMLQGDGNCAKVVWTFLGISIPGWSLLAFIALIGTAMWQLLRREP